MRLTLAVFCLVGSLWAQAPEFYSQLPEIFWVVDDAPGVAAGWKRVGVPSTWRPRAHKGVNAKLRGRNVSYTARVLTAGFANVRAHWVQPLSGKSSWSEFLKTHGSGIFAVAYRVPSVHSLEDEVVRLRSGGVPVLERGTLALGSGRRVQYVLLDTAGQGKYCLGLLLDLAPGSSPEQGRLSITQFALVARDLDGVSTYWQRLGFPAFSFTHPELTDKIYKGSPAGFDIRVGWQRQLSIPFEWIQPLKGPNIYEDHIAKHGEGFQHIAFNVPDLDEASSRWDALGFPVTQSGGWGEKDRPGSGRFAYHDTHAAGGIDIELLWNYRTPGGVGDARPPAAHIPR